MQDAKLLSPTTTISEYRLAGIEHEYEHQYA
jgi:hypothetical protein